MKITQDSLSEFPDVVKISPTAREPVPPEQRATDPANAKLTYDHSKATLFQEEERKVYVGPLDTYLQAQGFTLCRTMEDALRMRHTGQKVLTLRECDTAARKQLDLSCPKIWRAMWMFDSIITEGFIGEEFNPWELRAAYTRGRRYMREDFDRDEPARQKRATEKMSQIIDELTGAGLRIWDEEQEFGFHTELCKPEYMTWGQYEHEKKRMRRVVA